MRNHRLSETEQLCVCPGECLVRGTFKKNLRQGLPWDAELFNPVMSNMNGLSYVDLALSDLLCGDAPMSKCFFNRFTRSTTKVLEIPNETQKPNIVTASKSA